MSALPKFNESSYAHFVTTKTFSNHPFFKDDGCCRILIKEVDFYRNKLDFKLLGYVIMPDHLHLIIFWDIDKYPKLTISRIMHGIKGSSSYLIHKYFLGRPDNPVGPQRRDKIVPPTPCKGIWQPDFYDFNIYTNKKLNEKLDYIHNNPFKAGLVKNIEDYLWSSYRNYFLNNDSIIKIDVI